MKTSWTDGQTDEWTDGQAGGQKHRQKDRPGAKKGLACQGRDRQGIAELKEA